MSGWQPAGQRQVAVGLIGLGSMGMGVARTLLHKGFETHAYDVRADVLKAFAKDGGIAHRSPAELGAEVGVVIVLVVNADQTSTVLFGKEGAAGTLARGSVVVSSATVAPEFAIDLGERLDSKGLLMIDAPVSGGAARAAKGELSIMASGSKQAFSKADSTLSAMESAIPDARDCAAPGRMNTGFKLPISA